MTEQTKPTPEEEVLSRFLDELNAGKTPEGDTGDVKELLEVAALIRQADLPAEPPRHLVEETVAQFLSERPQAQQRPSRTWLYSGLLGAAASVLLVVGLRLTPVTAPPTFSAIEPSAARTQAPGPAPQAANPEAVAAQASPGIAEKSSPAPMPETSGPAAPAMPSSVRANQPAIPPVAPSPAADMKAAAKATPPPAAPRTLQKSILAADSAIMAETKSAPHPLLSEAELIAPAAKPAPLALPGHTPATITSDEQSGQIQQVFYPGTKQELVITQKPLAAAPPASAKQAAPAPGRTSVTLSLHNQQVTLEGYRSEAELLALANTLQPGKKQ